MEPSSLKGKKFQVTELDSAESEAVLSDLRYKRKRLDAEEGAYLEMLGKRVLKRNGAPEGAFATKVVRSSDGRSVVEVEVIEAAPIADAIKLLPPAP